MIVAKLTRSVFFQAASVPFSAYARSIRSPFRALCKSPRSAKLQRNAASYTLPWFPQAKGDDLVKLLDPCQQGFRPRNRQEHQSSCAAPDRNPPCPMAQCWQTAEVGAQGEKQNQGGQSCTCPHCAFPTSNHSRRRDFQS